MPPCETIGQGCRGAPSASPPANSTSRCRADLIGRKFENLQEAPVEDFEPVSFPFDKIKIDRSFIRELGKDNDCMAIIRAVMRLGSSLGMVTTAEGVETEEQLEILRAEGCVQVQGFLFSKAVPAGEIPQLLRRLQPRIRAA